MRSDVSASSRSRIVPSAYVLPEPDWPQRNVWRSNAPASRASGTLSAKVSEPTSSTALAGRTASSQRATSAAAAMRVGVASKGRSGPSRSRPSTRTEGW